MSSAEPDTRPQSSLYTELGCPAATTDPSGGTAVTARVETYDEDGVVAELVITEY